MITPKNLAKWREEYFKYCEYKKIKVLDIVHLKFYIEVCQKRQAEIDELCKNLSGGNETLVIYKRLVDEIERLKEVD
jgi:hypothetical protein